MYLHAKITRMAKLRQNHQKAGAGGYATKTGVFMVFVGLLYAGFQFLGKGGEADGETRIVINAPKDDENNPNSDSDNYMLHSKKAGTIVRHDFYALSYDEKNEQAEWVSYYISRKRLNNKRAKRKDWFEKDPKVKTGSATYKDYKGSGYDKGHLAPAADMAFDVHAMEDCFFMSNMSPQVHNFNGGIWRELEEQTRDWARMYDKLFVVTGPIFKDNIGEIGRQNKVTVPGYYYKILLDIEGKEKKAIGFVMPHEVSNKPITAYIKTIDEIEEITGIDFFPALDDELEDELESKVIQSKWKFNKNLFKIRTEKWNVR